MSIAFHFTLNMKIDLKSLFIIHVFIILQYCGYWVIGKPQVPCFFIFGDSLSDNGNNNNLLTTAKTNYKPYGLDFPQGPTGRFTNGRNLPDFIAEYLDFENLIPPFAMIKNSKGIDILQGVNYASGGAGIRPESGKLLGKVISLDEQLKNHNYTISKINSLFGKKKNATETHLKRCLYMVEMGTNDYLNNYFLPLYPTKYQFSPQEYANALIQRLSSQFKALYNQGARKIAAFGVGVLGCTPYARANFDTQGSPCVEKFNNDVQLFNTALKSLVQDFNANFTDSKFIFIDMFSISTTGTSNQGQIISDAPCCEVPPTQIQCTRLGKVCGNRSEYIFWDRVHPTESSFMTLANRSFNAQLPTDSYPFDISHLAQMSLT